MTNQQGKGANPAPSTEQEALGHHRIPPGGHHGGMEIWINPACSKCASALSLLDAEGAQYTVRKYLEDPPNAAELEAVLARLGLEPWDITRTGEEEARQLEMADWPREPADRDRWIEALVAHPVLIQRPIITAQDGAVVGRSEAAVREALRRPASAED